MGGSTFRKFHDFLGLFWEGSRQRQGFKFHQRIDLAEIYWMKQHLSFFDFGNTFKNGPQNRKISEMCYPPFKFGTNFVFALAQKLENEFDRLLLHFVDLVEIYRMSIEWPPGDVGNTFKNDPKNRKISEMCYPPLKFGTFFVFSLAQKLSNEFDQFFHH